jgi:hypothetical protein
MRMVSHAPLPHSGAKRLCSTMSSVAQKEGQNLSNLALFASVSSGALCHHVSRVGVIASNSVPLISDVSVTSFSSLVMEA